ncbi:MAG: RibD family protein [Acidobacteriota bacterium]
MDPAYTQRARKLNEAFVHFMSTGRPLVTLKAALTLDGKIAAPDDGASGNPPGFITSDLARAHVQTLRHHSDAILTGIGTVLSDDCRMTDRTGLPRSRPLMRIVVDSQLRIPMDSNLVATCKDDVLVVTTSAASDERRKRLEGAGVRIEIRERTDGRVDLPGVVNLLARERYLSLMIEAGSRVNWAVLEAGVADKIFFYYAPKILGGLHSLPVAGGVGRRRRKDALQFRDVRLHTIGSGSDCDEFAVEAWVCKEA